MSSSRERLLEAATELFVGGSFHKVGIAEICTAAAVNKGTFYHFFPSKIELLLEVIEGYVTRVSQKYRDLAAANESGRRKLQGVFAIPQEQNLAWKNGHGTTSGCLLGTIILELAANEPLVRDKAIWGLNEWSIALQPIVQEFLSEEKIRGIDVQSASEILIGFVQGAHVMAKLKNDPSLFAVYGQLTVDMLCAANSEK